MTPASGTSVGVSVGAGMSMPQRVLPQRMAEAAGQPTVTGRTCCGSADSRSARLARISARLARISASLGDLGDLGGLGGPGRGMSSASCGILVALPIRYPISSAIIAGCGVGPDIGSQT